MVPNDDHSNRWNQAQKVLAWVEIGIQFIIQILIIHQWARYTPEEAINLIRIEHSLKDEDEDYVIRLPEGLLNPQFRFLFTLLTFGLGITHGYANMKVQKSLNEDHFQLLIYSCICFCNWQEAKVFLGKYDIIIGGFSYLLCALIDFDNYSRQEVFFIFLSFALFMCTYIYTFLFQSYGMTFTDNEGKNGVEAQKTPQSQVNNNLLSSGDENQNKKLIQNSNFNIDKQQSSKRIMFFQFPFSQSINQNNINLKRPSQFTFDPQISASRRTIGNGTYAYVMNSEMVLDTKMSRILNSVNPNVSVPKFSAIQENINQHLLFYQGMIDKLDSAIFVIGGPNQVFEALNVKASSFFTPYFISIGEDSSNNFKKVFESITLKDYNKSCYQYLESLGISRVELPTCSSPKVFTKKGTLNNFFNSQTPNLQNQRTKSPSLHQNQNLKQSLAYQNSFNFNKQHTVQSQEGYDESIRKQTSNDPKKLQRNQTTISSFPDISLLGLLEKLLACKKLDSQSECIEIIDFQTTKELQNILQYVQIKVYGYQLNGEEFLFVSFAKNQEREEIMRQKIHKDIEYSTFKTISHELGTYINFMLLILEGIFLNILIEISKYNNTHQIMLYYSNFSKIGAMIDKSIPQKCKDDYFNVIYSFFYIQLLPHLFLTRELKRINFKYFKCQKLNLLIKNNEIIILIILGNKNLYNNAQFLSCIIQDIRDYHSHLNKNLKVQIKSTQIRTLILNTCMLFSQITKMKEIEFEVLINEDVPPKIFTDKQKIQQILIHLIQNALKFSRQKSSICVSVSMSSQTQNKQKIICFTVADIGIGMDEEEQQRLRQLLDNVYLSEKVSIHSSGFGFGLTISNILSKKLHSNHHASQDTVGGLTINVNTDEEFSPGIHFSSTKNVGSDFRFYINATDSENIVALSVSNEKSDKTLYKSAKIQRVKINEYEYFEHEDDIEISKRELNAENNLELKVIENFGDFYSTLSVQKSIIARPLSKKITLTFEKGHFINKATEKSRFGFGLDPLGLGKTNTLLGENNNNNRLNVDRKSQKKFTQSFLINSFYTRRSETLVGLENDIDEDVQAGQMPVFNKSIKPIKYTMKILIVDDEMMNIFGLKMMFKLLGVDQNLILQANNGEEALDLYQKHLQSDDKFHQIKLVIMDINMPVMDGIEAAEKICELISSAKLENRDITEANIVACSSYDDYDTKLSCLNAGMISYISKPCNRDSVQHIVEKYYYNEKK